MLNADAKDPTDPTERTEPTDPIDRTDPRDPIDRNESCDARDHLDDGLIAPLSTAAVPDAGCRSPPRRSTSASSAAK